MRESRVVHAGLLLANAALLACALMLAASRTLFPAPVDRQVVVLATTDRESPTAPAVPSERATTAEPTPEASQPPPAPAPAPAPVPSAPSPPPSEQLPPPEPPPSAPEAGPSETGNLARDAEAWSLELLNDERADGGLDPLDSASDLTRFARDWAERMSEIGMQHSTDSSRLDLIKGDRSAVGENVGWLGNDSLSPQEAAAKLQDLWRESDGHYANQMKDSWTEVGVGLYHDGSGWWAVHVFSDG